MEIIGEHQAIKRKKDMVTWLAVFLFLLITFLELAIVIWIPMHLRSASLWEKESAFQEMIELEDLLRANFSSYARKCKGTQEGEITIVRICLDDYARYIRAYGSDLSRNQIRDIYLDLKEFEKMYFQMKEQNQFYTMQEKIDRNKYIQHLLTDCGIEETAIKSPKKEISTENGKRKTGQNTK